MKSFLDDCKNSKNLTYSFSWYKTYETRHGDFGDWCKENKEKILFLIETYFEIWKEKIIKEHYCNSEIESYKKRAFWLKHVSMEKVLDGIKEAIESIPSNQVIDYLDMFTSNGNENYHDDLPIVAYDFLHTVTIYDDEIMMEGRI